MRFWPRTTEHPHPAPFDLRMGCFDTGGSEQTGTVETRVSSQPFPAQKQAFERGFERAEDQFGTPIEFFPGSTVVPFAPQQEEALGLAEDLFRQGNPLLGAAEDTILQTARGDFLNRENPAFQALSDRITGDITNRVNSQFTGSGRRGSSANQETLTRGIGDALAPLAFQNFAQERANQLNAAQIAPGLSAQRFADIDRLSGIGAARQGQAGAELQDLINRFNFQQQEPRNRLQEFLRLIGGGSAGTTSTSSRPVFENRAATNLGLASLGIGAGTQLLGSGGFDVLSGAGDFVGDLFTGGSGGGGSDVADIFFSDF